MAEWIDRVPTPAEFRSLAEAVGWVDHFDWSSIAEALAGSRHGVVVTDESGPIGAGRLVGDGVRYWYVQDVMVRPDESGEGVATEIVERLLAWVRSHAGDKAVVGLFASPEAEGVYASLGFERALDDPLGMTLDLNR